MKQIQSIEELYTGLIEGPGESECEGEGDFKGKRNGGSTLFVVPRIRYDVRRSDYLYQLYRPMLSSDRSNPSGHLDGVMNHSTPLTVRSLSFWEHRLLLKAVFQAPSRSLLHYHWFEIQDLRSLAGMVWKWFCLFWFRKRGGKIVWTIHNRMPHNPVFPRLNLVMRRWLASVSDRIHLHCREIADDVQEYYRVDASKIVVLPHPTFEARILERTTALNTLSQTRNLPINPKDTLFLMFGQISHYKQIVPVCDLFAAMKGAEPLAESGPAGGTEQQTESGPAGGVYRLLIAGPVKKGQQSVLRQIQTIADHSDNIHIIADWIPDEEMDLLFSASDCVILNMKEIWMSGVAMMARSYQKPLILPRTGCLPSLNQPGSSSMLHFFSDHKELTDAIQQFRRTT